MKRVRIANNLFSDEVKNTENIWKEEIKKSPERDCSKSCSSGSVIQNSGLCKSRGTDYFILYQLTINRLTQ